MPTTLSYAGSTASVTVNLAKGTASGFTSIASILNVTGGGQADNLTGSTGNNTLIGGGGADTLNGEGGADLLIGGDGADTINTGAANGNDQARYQVQCDNRVWRHRRQLRRQRSRRSGR